MTKLASPSTSSNTNMIVVELAESIREYLENPASDTRIWAALNRYDDIFSKGPNLTLEKAENGENTNGSTN